MLAPISSIPSWVLSILFILIFAVTLRILPPGGMYGSVPPNNNFERILIILHHMILPVMAILFSMLWQYVYIWRTFFLIFADEDYVELARAKGLPNTTVERDYILRPTLPYIITNFALMLVSFWQMSTALEKVLNWPGIGRLYIKTLPNFFSESFSPGVMPITLGIVVIFAYLLGITVLLLDVAYALLDPRVRVGDQQQTAQPVAARRSWRDLLRRRQTYPQPVRQRPIAKAPAEKTSLRTLIQATVSGLAPLKSATRELLRFPSAIFGLVVILMLVGGSVYAVIAYPYNQIGAYWYTKNLTGKNETPKLALPEWVNWFRADKLPLTLILDSSTGAANKVARPNAENTRKTRLEYTIPYPYTGGFPSDVVIYFDPKFTAKAPFALLTWVTPDGREFELGRVTATPGKYFTVSNDLSAERILAKHSAWLNWFVLEGGYPTPRVQLLFADPAAHESKLLPGTYTLRMDVTTFEKDSTLDAEFVLLGQVSGSAGTDYMGRDLLLPLLWGMPFALVFGLLGACVTTFLSMAVAATGVWLGGWVDSLIQQLVEANMILPVIAIGVLIYSYFNVSIWVFLSIIVLLNVFGSPTKSFRAALLQVKDAPYLEAARAYGASNTRIIFQYLIPRILPVLIPQLVTLIPSYVFLEATLGIFNVKSDYPTWGRIIYEALRHGANYGSSFWVLEPLSLLLLTGLAFAMLGFALERVLNPRIREV
jgi:peptide/nickel transport system permease protein